jgi:uncharacterized alpha-E superfamily protein
MKNLVQEAEQYAEKSNINLVGKRTKHRDKYTIADFIAGATSKWVQAEKINAKIEGLLLANDNPSGIFYRISELEQKLKKLEDETKI